MKIIIGVSGFAGSGKDTFGAHLVKHHGFVRTALADPLKEICKQVYDFTDEQLYGSSSKRNQPDERYLFSGICPTCHESCKGPAEGPGTNGVPMWKCFKCNALYHTHLTPRLALQALGTEWGRTLYDNTWVDLTVRKIRESSHQRFVITDVRFRNEIAGLSNGGAKLVRLKRGSQAFSHKSEAEMASIEDSAFDFVIDNQGTLEFLYNEADRVMRELGVG